mmetsp:Transcript_29174/g.52238  ORF Transcript_29174/g.52238 Transcript_29174/m.52238 type:complete len:236 (-) Transcript_29174:1294-2001(-)
MIAQNELHLCCALLPINVGRTPGLNVIGGRLVVEKEGRKHCTGFGAFRGGDAMSAAERHDERAPREVEVVLLGAVHAGALVVESVGDQGLHVRVGKPDRHRQLRPTIRGKGEDIEHVQGWSEGVIRRMLRDECGDFVQRPLASHVQGWYQPENAQLLPSRLRQKRLHHVGESTRVLQHSENRRRESRKSPRPGLFLDASHRIWNFVGEEALHNFGQGVRSQWNSAAFDVPLPTAS